MKHRVTVGVDGSPESPAAAVRGAQEASLRKASLSLIHVIGWPISPAVPRLERERADRWADEAFAEALKEVHRRAPTSGDHHPATGTRAAPSDCPSRAGGPCRLASRRHPWPLPPTSDAPARREIGP
ncbi:universal stress protein [Streptomyces sp. NBC_00057]|uniref:universal stress protein n=1 Tax=Streptomyces sp. NBC_00057 TaxID=2975634 RepID=UPI003248108F